MIARTRGSNLLPPPPRWRWREGPRFSRRGNCATGDFSMGRNRWIKERSRIDRDEGYKWEKIDE